GLVATLGASGTLAVLGAAATREEALAIVAAARPDVVAIDVTAREGIEIARALRFAHNSARLVAFAIEGQEHDLRACADAGIAGFVPHDATTADLVGVIAAVMHDGFACPPGATASLLRGFAAGTSARAPAPGDALTRREREIVSLIDAGLSNKEIALELVIEVATVKNHVHNILDKLQVTSRAAAAARVRGILPRSQPATV